jgi:hypothetical protein
MELKILPPLVLSETLVERGRALKYYIALPIFFSSRESSWGACHVSIAYCGDPGTSPMFRVCHRDNDDLLTFVTKSDKLHHLAHQGRLSRGHFRKTKAGCGARARIDAIRSRAALGHRSAVFSPGDDEEDETCGGRSRPTGGGERAIGRLTCRADTGKLSTGITRIMENAPAYGNRRARA